MNEDMKIRVASPDDAEELLAIYAPYVEKTAITFEYDVPSVDDFRSRIIDTLYMHPYLCLCKGDEILGYAYTSSFGMRKAYDWSVETSIYMKEGTHKKGLGRMLYEELERVSALQNIQNMNACIAYPADEACDEHLDLNSVKFHEHLGYNINGHFHKCGCKFGKWYDMVWMEKIIGNHDECPEDVVPFSKLVINKA